MIFRFLLSCFFLFSFHFSFAQIFQDDMMSESTGSFPSKWEVVNGSAMVNVSPTGEKAVEMEHLSIIRPIVNSEKEGYLGQEFTVTFKVYFNEEQYLGRQEYLIRLWDGNNYKSDKMKMGPISVKRHGAATAYFDPAQKNVSKFFPTNTPENGYDPNTKMFAGMWRTIKLIYKEGSLSLFLDDIPVFVIPEIPLEPSMVSFGCIEKMRQVKDYFTAFRDVTIYNSASPEPSKVGCDALRMELIDGHWKMLWDPQDPPDYAPIINIEGNESLIVHPGNYTGKPSGEKLWKNIKPFGNDYYSLEFVDDVPYTGVKIYRLNIDEFVLREYRVDGDSIQTVWQRIPKYYESDETGSGSGSGSEDQGWPKELPGQISDDQILFPGPPGTEVDYYTDRVVDITANLEIMNDVTIEFGENGGLGVYDNGWLIISGVGSSKVVLRAKDATKGWRGIHIETDKQNGIYSAEISNAGNQYVYCCNEKAAVFVQNQGNIAITDSNITNSGGYGIYIGQKGEVELHNNSFSGNTEEDVWMED